MKALFEFLTNLHSANGIQALLRAGGLVAITGIVFSETGLLVGFFLPGDSLLVAAGIFAASDGNGGPPLFNIYFLQACVTSAAVIGDQLGFYLGHKTGGLVYNRPDGIFFKRRHLIAAQEFYAEYGGRSLVMARFIPIFRTFVPFVAGMAGMPYRRFVGFSILGGILWCNTLIPLGYFLGRSPLANQLHRILIVVIFVSLLPMIISTGKTLYRRFISKK